MLRRCLTTALCVVHDLIFQRKLSTLFTLLVTQARKSDDRSRLRNVLFKTSRDLFSIQLLRKPKILSVEDKQTKFDRSKGDLGQFSELGERL